MDQCRICLCAKRKMCSIFEPNGTISYANMLTSIANVTAIISESTGKLCSVCCKKLTEAYEFIELIERSEKQLSGFTVPENLKKIKFNDINDIIVKTEFMKIEKDTVPIKSDIMSQLYISGTNSLCYSDTVIKKLNENTDIHNEPLSIEFFKNIKAEPMENFDDDDHGAQDDAHDGDYLPTYMQYKLKQKHRKRKEDKWLKKQESENNRVRAINVCIKPKFISDLRLINTKPEKKPPKIGPMIEKPKNYEVCPYCGKTSQSLKNHILIHTAEKKYKCDQCPSCYYTEYKLEKHKKKHTSDKKFKCDQCIAAFFDASGLKSHMRMHSEEKKFICEICSKAFKRRAAMYRHRIGHNSANKNIMCDLCNMSFFTKYGLRHHMRVHTGERPFNCEICSQPYSYKHDFNRHCFKKHGIFLKRRSVYVMNEEVLRQEQEIMKDLMLRVRGIVRDGEPINPFTGPQAALAFEQAVKNLNLSL